jgi:hypothetical protein
LSQKSALLTYIPAKHKNDRINGMSFLYLVAFVRKIEKNHGQTARNSSKFLWGVPFGRNKKEFLAGFLQFGGSKSKEWKKECTI